jgi:two-component system, NtrC family, sensor histidine kinase KinB
MLRIRLYLGLLPLLLLFIAVSGVTTVLYQSLVHSLEQNLTGDYRAMINGYEMREATNFMAAALVTAQRGDVATARARYSKQRARFQKQLMEESLASVGTPRTQLLEKLDAAFAELDGFARKTLDEGADASLAAWRDSELIRFRVLEALEALTQSDYADFQDSAAHAARLARTSINFLIAAMVGAILLSVYLSYRLANSLLRPITALKNSAAALGEGQLDHDVPVTTRDELGDLARTFNTMAAKLRDYRDAMTKREIRSRRTMEATLTSTPDPLFVINADGTHEVRNPAAKAIAVLPEFSGGLPSVLEAPLNQVLATGSHFLPTGYDQVVTLHVDGGERHYLPRILAIGDSLTGFGGAAVILQDVTKFRLLDDVKGNLVSTVSHELKTPLTSLTMVVHLLLEQSFGPINAKQRDMLEDACADADRLLRILNDLLDLSRLESGASALNRQPVPVAGLLAGMADEIRSITDAAAQTIVTDVRPVLTTVNVDADRIRHVFVNLLTNASKYSPENTIITLYAEPAGDGFIRFGVRDQGPGIPAESLTRIFDRFYRVPGQTKKGSGLGLTISREIVVAHGGSIACSCKDGEGCDFYFLLPER